MNRKKPVFSTIVYVLCLIAMLGAVGYAFFDKTTVSQAENRSLAELPDFNKDTWFDGSFASDMESFLSDHIYRRADVIDAAKAVENLLENETEMKIISQNTDIGVDTGTENANAVQLPGTAQTPVQEVEQDEYVVLSDRIVAVYLNDSAAEQTYISTANRLFAALPDKINRYLLLAPSRIAFETPDVARLADDQRAAIDQVYKNIDPDVVTLDAYSRLEAHRDEELYFRLDHHWTQLGAYYGAQALFEAANIESIALSEYRRIEADPYLGYLYAKNPDPSLKEHPDDLTVYLYGEQSCSQTVYLWKDDAYGIGKSKVLDTDRGGYYSFVDDIFSYTVVEGRNANGGSLLVVGDSYANAMMPWLADHFKSVILIDPRFYHEGHAGLMQLIDEHAVTDFMLVDYTSVLSAPYFAGEIARLCE